MHVLHRATLADSSPECQPCPHPLERETKVDRYCKNTRAAHPHRAQTPQLIGGLEPQQTADWSTQAFQKSKPGESPGNSVSKTQNPSM